MANSGKRQRIRRRSGELLAVICAVGLDRRTLNELRRSRDFSRWVHVRRTVGGLLVGGGNPAVEDDRRTRRERRCPDA